MYSNDDPLDNIIEDAGNMRPLSEEQILFLCERPRTDIIGVLITLNHSLQLAIEAISVSQMNTMRQNSENFSAMVSRKVRTARKKDVEDTYTSNSGKTLSETLSIKNTRKVFSESCKQS